MDDEVRRRKIKFWRTKQEEDENERKRNKEHRNNVKISIEMNNFTVLTQHIELATIFVFASFCQKS